MNDDAPPHVIATADLPLSGVRVVDLSFFLPGAYCTQLLGDLGAEIIKVEPIGGEAGRTVLKGNFWYSVNRGKRSICVNLKDPAGQALCQELAASSAVVIEGFRPGTAARLGMDYETLRQRNPQLVYCSMSGYGQQGPLRDEPGHDVNYLASGGGLAVSGHWSELPRRSGMPIADLGSGTMAALSISAALFRRDAGGKGAYIDLALRDVCLSYASSRSGFSFEADAADQDHLWPMNDVFATSDGHQVALGIVEDHFWVSFVAAVAPIAPDLGDESFASGEARRRNGDRLKLRLTQLFAANTSDFWIELLVSKDVPIQRVLDLSEALEHPQTRARGLRQEVAGQRFVGFPALFDNAVAPVRSAGPDAGADTADVLHDVLGIAEEDFDALRARRTVG